MAKVKIEKNSIHGAFRAVKRFESDDGKLRFGCYCTKCNEKAKFSDKQLRKNPICKKCGHLGNELILLDEDDLRLDKYIKTAGNDLKKISKMFGAEAKEIMDLMEQADKSKGIQQFQSAVLKRLVGLVEIAEEEYRNRPGQANAVAMTVIVNQARELINDIQAAADKNDLPNRIAMDVLNPEFVSLGHNLINQMYYLKRAIDSDVKDNRKQIVDESINDVTREMAKFVEQMYAKLRDRLKDYLE